MLNKLVSTPLNLVLAGLLMLAFNAQSATVQEVITAKIEGANDRLKVMKVEPTKREGISRVTLSDASGGTSDVYATNDGAFFFSGDMWEVKPDKLVNQSDMERGEILNKLDKSNMIVFAPQGEPKAEVYIFTDVDCGYCRKLHTEMPVMNALGIQVNYLAFPRSGPTSRTAGKMRSVWCAENPLEAMTMAKQGQNLENPGSCDNPVNAQYALGLRVGVQGTPAIYSTEGEHLGGYLSGQDLAKGLGL